MSDENVIIVAFGQGYKLFGFLQDLNSKKYNYRTLLFGMFKKPTILAKFRYQDITQWELMHKEHSFARHILKLFFKP